MQDIKFSTRCKLNQIKFQLLGFLGPQQSSNNIVGGDPEARSKSTCIHFAVWLLTSEVKHLRVPGDWSESRVLKRFGTLRIAAMAVDLKRSPVLGAGAVAYEFWGICWLGLKSFIYYDLVFYVLYLEFSFQI